MNIEIKLERKGDPIVGVSELLIIWRKRPDLSALTVECGKENYDVKTEGDIEDKILGLLKNISLNPLIQNEEEYMVLDGAGYVLSVEQELFSLSLEWHESLPEEWAGLKPLVEYLKQISNAENLCDGQKAGGPEKIREYIQKLPFTEKSLSALLQLGAAVPAGVTHRDIADWCSRFAQHCRDEYDAGRLDLDHHMKRAENIAEDVDAQWELFLENTYSVEELREMDLSRVMLPKEWFLNWLDQLETK